MHTPLRTNTTTLLSQPNGDGIAEAVRGRSWAWVRALCERLNVEVYLVDAAGAVVALGPAVVPVDHEELPVQDPTLRTAIAAALQRQPPQSVVIGGVQMVCVAVSPGQPPHGVLVVTRRSTPASAQKARGQLESIAQWLGPAIAAHLQSEIRPDDDGAGRVASLIAVLDAAAMNGSDREAISAFADAFAIWYDLELTGYVETPERRYVREVTLPGADLSSLPAIIRAEDLPADLVASTLVKADVDRLDIADGGGVFVMRIDGVDSPAWLLVMRPVTTRLPDPARIGVYGRLLEQWLAGMAAQAVNAAVDRVGRALFTGEGDRAAAADLALADLRQTLRLDVAHVMLAPKSGPLILDAGTPPVDHVRESRGVVLMFPLGEGFSLSFSASHGPSRHLSPLDRRVIDAVAHLFALWARQVAQPVPAAAAPERRSGHVRFDEMLERLTRQALERGEPVTLIVAMLADDAAADATATVATGVRSQLRPWDVVGVLRDREVGLLLHDTSREQALRIVGRIRAFVESTERGRVSAVGVASRGGPESTGAAGSTSIVQEARDRAVRRNVA